MKSEDKILIDVNETMKITGLKKDSAYRLIRETNEDLRKEGYVIFRGKTNKRRLLERLGEKGVCV
ncbi:MAG: hypothetical protein MSH33_10575 [Fusobacterium necrophorum]|nr:hypothetical protein [Fusobacterium necrophorum]